MLESKQKQFLSQTKGLCFIVYIAPTLFWDTEYSVKVKCSLCMLRVQRLEGGLLDEVHGAILSFRFCYIYDFLDK